MVCVFAKYLGGWVFVYWIVRVLSEWHSYLDKTEAFWAHYGRRQQNGELCQLEFSGHLFFYLEGISTIKVFF